MDDRHYLPGSILPSTQGKTCHLGSNTNTALIQHTDGILVALTLFSQQVALGDDDVIKVEHTGARGPDTKLLLLLGDREARGPLLHDESRDTLVALTGVQVGEDNEHIGLHGVGDPHLGSVQLIPVRSLLGLGLQRKGIGPGAGLRQTKRANGACGQLGQEVLLQLRAAVFHDRGVDERVVHIGHHADTGVYAGQLLDGHNRGGEVHACAAVFLGDFDAHHALFEELLDHGGVHGLGFVHVADFRADLFLGKLGHCFRHEGFGLGEEGNRGWGEVGEVGIPPAGGGRECMGAGERDRQSQLSWFSQQLESSRVNLPLEWSVRNWSCCVESQGSGAGQGPQSTRDGGHCKGGEGERGYVKSNAQNYNASFRQ